MWQEVERMMNPTSNLFVFHAIKKNPTGEPAMKCITIERTVDAWHVEALLIRAKEDFSTLPAWVKRCTKKTSFLLVAVPFVFTLETT